MSPQLVKLLASALVVLGLLAWGFYERSGKLSAQGALELSEEHVREQNRGITALGNATMAAQARAALLEEQRRKLNAPLVASIARLEQQIKASSNGKDCRDALKEWRSGQ